jgi:DNA-binding transcriptional LysR family regulator
MVELTIGAAEVARSRLTACCSVVAFHPARRARRDLQLRVSASMTVSQYLMPDLLSQLQLRTPQMASHCACATFRWYGTSSTAKRSSLRRRTGRVRRPADPHPHGRRAGDRVAAEHPWARRRLPVGAAALSLAPFTLHERGSGIRDILEAALALAGARRTITPRLELASTLAIEHAVMTGQGVGVLSQLAVAEDRDSGRLREVRAYGVDLRRNLRIAWRTGSQLHGVAASSPPSPTQDRSAGRPDRIHHPRVRRR